MKTKIQKQTSKEKPVQKKKSHVSSSDDSHSKYYTCVQKPVTKSSTTEHWIYLNVDKESAVDSLTQKGTRLLVARYPDFYKIYLYKTHIPGESSWPNGGVTVYNSNYEMLQSFYYDSVAIHPEGGSYKFQT
jgi:hypothetical protein